MSAGLAGLWSVWALIDAVRGNPARSCFAPLLAETRECRPAELAKWRDSLPAVSQPGVTTMHALEDDPPLPFFVLLEAASASEHPGLGVLGSIIVAEAIFGALARDRLPVEQLSIYHSWSPGARMQLDAIRRHTAHASARHARALMWWRRAPAPDLVLRSLLHDTECRSYGNSVVAGSAWIVAGPVGAVLQRRLPTVKQSGQLGCHATCAVWQAVQRHCGSGSADAA